MEQLSIYLSERMVVHGIIPEESKPNYIYSIQLLLEKAVGITLMLVAALCFHIFIPVAAFLLIFIAIRKSSDGIHCNTTIGCFCASVGLCLSTKWIAPILSDNYTICRALVILAMVILYIIANVNNPDMHLTEEELTHLKARSRITVLITGGMIIIATVILPQNEIVSYMALGVIYNALSVLIAKLIGRRRQCDD